MNLFDWLPKVLQGLLSRRKQMRRFICWLIGHNGIFLLRGDNYIKIWCYRCERLFTYPIERY